jgi:hypothetical protein
MEIALPLGESIVSLANWSPTPMDIKLFLVAFTVVFTAATLFFGTRNGFYNSKAYHGNGSAH